VAFIRSGDEFDKFVNRLYTSGITVVVDPLMNMNREVIKGFVIKDYYEVVGGRRKMAMMPSSMSPVPC
jgi:hypothetical protein